MIAQDRRTVQIETARALAAKVDAMARVGGSAPLTEALDAVAKMLNRVAGDIANGAELSDVA